jgi:two-component system, NtrC family, sensor kinase
MFFERTRYHLDAIAGAGRLRAPDHRRSRSELLSALHGARPDHRFLGVSRTETGEFLSSDDVELLLTLANYVGIAIENANLYRR